MCFSRQIIICSKLCSGILVEPCILVFATTLSLHVFNGILLPKLFWPTVRKNGSSDGEKLLKFEAKGRKFEKFLRSLELFIQTVKGQNNFW